MHLRIGRLLPILAFTGLLQMNTVLGSVYSTNPYSKTKLFSGKPALITWKDDSRVPCLEDMPPMKIELWNNSNYVTTLAKHIHPKDRSHTVYIPSGIDNGSHYAVVFKTKDPPMTIWSADFTIVSEAQDYLFPARPIANSTSTSVSSTFNSATAPTAVHPNPIGARPSSPYRDGGESAKKGAATKLNLGSMQLRVHSILVLALVGVFMTL